jgi:hypothetical protein
VQTHAKRSSRWLSAVLVLAVVGLGIGIATGIGGSHGKSALRPDDAMVAALRAAGPHPSLKDHASVLGRLVGTWDVDYLDIRKDGTSVRRSGELVVGWVMDGRAMEDVWIVYPSAAGKEREVYADVRYFDAKSKTWPAIFIDPQIASVATFTGGAVGDDRFVLESEDLVAGQIRRWSFNDIRDGSVVFRDDASSDGGKTWILKSEYHMKRHAAVSTVVPSTRTGSRLLAAATGIAGPMVKD